MGNARKNTFPDRKDSTVQDVTGSPKSAGKILKELGSVFFRTKSCQYHFSTTSVGRIPILAARLQRIPSRIRRRVAGGAGTDFSGFHP